MRTFLLIMFILALCSGCATKRPLFKMPMVSMTEESVPSSRKLEDAGPVSAQYCPGDTPRDPANKEIGLLDEVIGKAQDSARASFIKNAQFYTVGNCVYLEGTAVRTM